MAKRAIRRHIARNRLTAFTRAGAETRYRYDANSNRLSAIDTISGTSDFDAVLDGASRTQLAEQSLDLDAASNKLLGFTQTTTTLQNGKTRTVVTTPISYQLDANGALTSDGQRSFEHDEARRLSKVKILNNGEAASIQYLHNALGQRVFKSDTQAEQTLPNEDELGQDFVTWLKKGFGWLFTQGHNPQTSLGQAFIHADGQIPEWALLGEYDNGSANTKGRAEYIWLPTEDGSAIPIGLARGGKLYAVHTDHLGTPRQMTDDGGATVWQWPYSAFGQNKPTGMLTLTLGSNGETQLKGTKPAVELNLRYPGQYFDEESQLSYNYFRNYDARMGRYTQNDPIGLNGGWNRLTYAGGDAVSTFDPFGLKSRHDPNGRVCQDHRNKISNYKTDINKRIRELAANPGVLPYYPPYPGAPARASQQGHEDLVRDLRDQLSDREKKFKEDCEDNDPPPPSPPSAPVCGDNCKQVLKQVRDAVTGAIIFTVVLICATS